MPANYLPRVGSAVHALTIGGTAVDTGLNTHPEFGAPMAATLTRQLELPLVQADNLFAPMADHEALVGLHASLKMRAIAGNDKDWDRIPAPYVRSRTEWRFLSRDNHRNS